MEIKTNRHPGLYIGQRMFLAVAPDTWHLFLEHYRPANYFVLETKVVDITGDGTYRFNTDYFVAAERLFSKLTDAKIKVCELFYKRNGERLDYLCVRLVSHNEERRESDKITARIEEVVKPQMERLAQDPHWQ